MRNQGNILFCGLGGQGVLLASEITAYSLLEAGFYVKKSEVHGMAQRGGNVIAHLRFGENIFSPLIDVGSTDIEVAFEKMESIRNLPLLKKGSRAIVNTQEIPPPAIAAGEIIYPQNILQELTVRGIDVTEVDALEISKASGSTKTVNMVLVGALSSFLPVEENVFLDVLNKRIHEKFRDVNISAFIAGRKRTCRK